MRAKYDEIMGELDQPDRHEGLNLSWDDIDLTDYVTKYDTDETISLTFDDPFDQYVLSGLELGLADDAPEDIVDMLSNVGNYGQGNCELYDIVTLAEDFAENTAPPVISRGEVVVGITMPVIGAQPLSARRVSLSTQFVDEISIPLESSRKYQIYGFRFYQRGQREVNLQIRTETGREGCVLISNVNQEFRKGIPQWIESNGYEKRVYSAFDPDDAVNLLYRPQDWCATLIMAELECKHPTHLQVNIDFEIYEVEVGSLAHEELLAELLWCDNVEGSIMPICAGICTPNKQLKKQVIISDNMYETIQNNGGFEYDLIISYKDLKRGRVRNRLRHTVALRMAETHLLHEEEPYRVVKYGDHNVIDNCLVSKYRKRRQIIYLKIGTEYYVNDFLADSDIVVSISAERLKESLKQKFVHRGFSTIKFYKITSKNKPVRRAFMLDDVPLTGQALQKKLIGRKILFSDVPKLPRPRDLFIEVIDSYSL